MLKSVPVCAVLIVSAVGLTIANAAPSHHQMLSKSKKTIAANGRCGGISYGTGARRCGTRSGGPPGGISGRN